MASLRSARNGRRSIATDDRPLTTKPEIADDVHEPLSVLPAASNTSSPYFTSLRRTTRSTTSTSTAAPQAYVKIESSSPSKVNPNLNGNGNGKRSKLDIAKYEYKPSTPPRKRTKFSNSTTTTPTIVKTENVDVDIEDSPNGSTSTPKTPKSASKKPFPKLSLDKPHPAPPRWEEQYRLIEHMRKGIIAPVDNMGCDRPRTVVNDDPKTLRFHMLISLMLSSQTKDPVTSSAVTTLHETLPGGLTAQSLADATTEEIQNCINKVGFWRRKADYIKDAAIHLLEKEDGDVPKTLEGLCELKGVGPKMAFLALQCAWDINAGIGVDVHVHRITNRLKWHKPLTTTPEGTRLNLQSWLPPELHKPINPLMVGFGQVICLPVGPRCDVCLLGQKKICPSRVTNVRSEGRKEVVFTFKQENDSEDPIIPIAKVEVGYDAAIVPPADLESGLMRIKDEPEAGQDLPLEGAGLKGVHQGHGVKMERDTQLETMIQEPGMRKVDEVLEILDRVDGAKDVDGNPA
ncbi:uncharacterized protein I303_102599 [Kwoniella dejecticola CBS 10117]|uniref:Endonuclease III homolog n=1 Tax=Kwoniella dejecticola CBS 10117 TaxID=1296121 RepID=A0A1A6A972_9TREE|nr:endonuclease III [Kwoniella dejecticola CBS 10117]OBR86604.1 endonuclease III [Kwoniella dejecticola CBS 10117]